MTRARRAAWWRKHSCGWGFANLKLGDKPQAISALERLTQEFPDKDKLLAIVGQSMPQLLDEMLKQVERRYIQEVDRAQLFENGISNRTRPTSSSLYSNNPKCRLSLRVGRRRVVNRKGLP
jgi:hypothetical protein